MLNRNRRLFLLTIIAAFLVCNVLATPRTASAEDFGLPFWIKSAKTGACLTLLGSPIAGTRIGTRPCNGRDSQKWYWEMLPMPDAGWLAIRSYQSPNKCIDLKGWTQRNGDIIHLWDCRSTQRASQSWFAAPFGNAGYQLRSGLGGNQCMDLQYWTVNDYVHTWQCSSSNSQGWIFQQIP